MIIPLLRSGLPAILLIGICYWGSQFAADTPAPSPVPAGLRVLALASAMDSEDPAQTLLQKAFQASDTARYSESAEDVALAELQRDACIAALTDLQNSSEFPWQVWFDGEKGRRPDAALRLFQAGHRASPASSLQWAIDLEKRTTPVSLRLEAHKVLWREDPNLAVQRGHRLSREAPRGTEHMHARYVAEVLAQTAHPMSGQILLAMAHRDGLESQARTLAIKVLVDRKRTDLAADMATLYKASTGDLLVRKRGLKAAVTLDPEFAKQILMTDVPSKADQPGLYNLVHELRLGLGLPPLP